MGPAAAIVIDIAATLFSPGKIALDVESLQITYPCADIELLRGRVKQLEQDIELLQAHEVGKLLTTIGGIGSRTAACLIAELGDPSRFRDAAALEQLRRCGAASPAIG